MVLWITGCSQKTQTAQTSCSQPKPNIVLILTDDLGWGDVSCYGATKIQTPNIDRLAAGGIRFTNGYAPSSTCTPTRYAIMTGQYGWRQSTRRTGILDGDAPLAIAPGSFTLPAMLQQAGYKTALVGKWHLGLGDGKTVVNFNDKIAPGPLEVGFDQAFFIPATVDRVPCVFIENHHVAKLAPADPIRVSYRGPLGNEPAGRDHPEMLKVPADNQHADVVINGISRIGYMTGGQDARWVDENITDTLADRTVTFLEQNKDRPFFLYLGTHDPHVPHMPHPRFRGKSGCGIRGDAIVQLDWLVGKVMSTLDTLGVADNTLVIFTSDNGPVLFDGYFDGSLEDVNGHQPAGGLHGWKYLVYEGGTRVPLIVRWPAKIRSGTTTDQMFCLVDLLSTCATITGQSIPPDTAIDSMELSDVLLGKTDRQIRNAVIQHGISDTLSIRQADWKFIPANAKRQTTGIGRGANPKDQRFAESIITEDLLFNLADDPAETKNIIDQHPQKAKQLKSLMEKIEQYGHR
ncbi:MAG: arylsulfatase [Phycisphaerae bacterium]|nr:arylsulfatase [Phycisphaerae bacterium]